MGSMSIRNIPEEDLVALKRLAARNNRSAEAEVRQAIANLVRASAGEGFGTRLHRHLGGAIDAEFEFERNRQPHQPIDIP